MSEPLEVRDGDVLIIGLSNDASADEWVSLSQELHGLIPDSVKVVLVPASFGVVAVRYAGSSTKPIAFVPSTMKDAREMGWERVAGHDLSGRYRWRSPDGLSETYIDA